MHMLDGAVKLLQLVTWPQSDLCEEKPQQIQIRGGQRGEK